jgi:hypothetical protein
MSNGTPLQVGAPYIETVYLDDCLGQDQQLVSFLGRGSLMYAFDKYTEQVGDETFPVVFLPRSEDFHLYEGFAYDQEVGEASDLRTVRYNRPR